MLETTSGMELWFCSGRVSSPCLVRRVESICKLAPVYNRFDQPLVVKIFGSIIRLGSYTRTERGRCRRTEWHTLFSFFHNVDQTIQYVAVRRSNRKVFHAGPIGTPDLKTRSSHRSPTREMPFQDQVTSSMSKACHVNADGSFFLSFFLGFCPPSLFWDAS